MIPLTIFLFPQLLCVAGKGAPATEIAANDDSSDDDDDVSNDDGDDSSNDDSG